MDKHKFDAAQHLTAQVIGCSVRDEEKVRVAVLDVVDDRVRGCELLAFLSPYMLAGHFAERPRPLGLGVAATLAVGTGHEGWRAADYWLDEAPHYERSEYDEFPFFWGPFQMDSSGSLVAAAVVSLLRRRWTDLPVNEADPRSCYIHLAGKSTWPEEAIRTAALSKWLGMPLPTILNGGGWNAVMTAYATWMGLRGAWTIDLHRLTKVGGKAFQAGHGENGWEVDEFIQPTLSFESMVFLAGPATFYWPPDVRKLSAAE